MHHNPPRAADVMQMRTVEKAQPQNCPLPFPAEGGERARSSDAGTARGNLMKHPPQKFNAHVVLRCINAILDAFFFKQTNYVVSPLFHSFNENMFHVIVQQSV